MRPAPAGCRVAIPEIMPAKPNARAYEYNDDSNPADSFELKPLRGNAAKTLRTK
jgi:hypothetical protein